MDAETRFEDAYYIPLLISILYLIFLYVSYWDVSIQHLSNAYCDDSALLMEDETSRFNLKGMPNSRFYFLFALLIILLVIYVSLFVIKILNSYNIFFEYIVPINWLTFFIIWAIIGILITYMFSHKSIPFMDYNTFSTNVGNLFGQNDECDGYSFAPTFDELPASIKKSIMDRYRKKKEKEFPNDTFTDADIMADLNKDLGTEKDLKANIHKYLNIPNDVKLLNSEYQKWLGETSKQMNARLENPVDTQNSCSKLIGKDQLVVDLVNNSSAYMANIKSLIAIAWILLAIIAYPLYSNHNLSKYVQQIALLSFVLIGLLLMYYFVMVRSDL
jgi:hypothetical protein